MKKLVSLTFATILILVSNAQSVQQQLDNCVPIEVILQSNPVDSLYNKTYQGGLIFYVNTSNYEGMVVSPNDLSLGVSWSLTQSTTGSTSAGITSASAWMIVADQGPGNYAAYLCDTLTLNGYIDWFLPSLGATDEMYFKLHSKGYGNFQTSVPYWSSYETGTGSANSRSFATGLMVPRNKMLISDAVRAVRLFTYSSIATHSLELGNDTAFCDGGSLTLAPKLGNGWNYNSYLWQDNSSNTSFTINSTGQYFVTTTNHLGCEYKDTINVIVNPIDSTYLGDSTICQGQTIVVFGTPQTTAGVYTDVVTSFTGCDSILSFEVIVQICTSLKENETEFGVTTYPNPVQSNLTISVEKSDLSISVYDMNGRLLLNQELIQGENTLYTETFAPAIYILRVENSAGEMEIFKIIKQ